MLSGPLVVAVLMLFVVAVVGYDPTEGALIDRFACARSPGTHLSSLLFGFCAAKQQLLSLVYSFLFAGGIAPDMLA